MVRSSICEHPDKRLVSSLPSPHAPPGEKWSGERGLISWACSQKVVRTNEIVRWWLFHSTSLTTVTFVITYVIEYPYLSWPGLVQISLNVARLHLQNFALAHWFTRPFLLVRGKGLGPRLIRDYLSKLWCFSIELISKNSGKTTINLPHVNLTIFSASVVFH